MDVSSIPFNLSWIIKHLVIKMVKIIPANQHFSIVIVSMLHAYLSI